jgi:hypothetical protein
MSLCPMPGRDPEGSGDSAAAANAFSWERADAEAAALARPCGLPF